MPRRNITIVSLCLICTLIACDNSKTNQVDSADQEPALAEYRKVEVDSKIISKVDIQAEKEVHDQEVSVKPRGAEKKPVSSTKPIKKKPVIVFDSLIYHLPDMYEGDQASLNLNFTNEGDGPLSIKGVDVVCGCTTPEVPFLDIPPGKEGKIGIQYNSVGKLGHQEPEITVLSNGIPRKTVLKIVVNVLDRKVEKDSVKLKTLQDSLPN